MRSNQHDLADTYITYLIERLKLEKEDMTKPEKEILIDAFRSLRLSADQGIALVRLGTPSQLLALSEEMQRLANQLAATIATYVAQGQTHGR